jgi:hypothetical protein
MLNHRRDRRGMLEQVAAMAGAAASEIWNVAFVGAPAYACEIAEVGLLNSDGTWSDAYLGAPTVVFGKVIGVRAKGRNLTNASVTAAVTITLKAPSGAIIGNSVPWTGTLGSNGVSGYTTIQANTGVVGQSGAYTCIVAMAVN